MADLQLLTTSYDVICFLLQELLQESLLLPSSRLNIIGFHAIRQDVVSSGARGLCVLIRNNYLFSSLDVSCNSHSSIEIMDLILHCSLDAPITTINLYRHPNTNTPFHVYSSLFNMVLPTKYSLIVGDFNAHHQAWGDTRIDKQGEHILHSINDHQFILLNDGAVTFLSGSSSSSIDLAVSSRDLGLLASFSTTTDLRGNDHFPVSIIISDTSPSSLRFSHKIRLSKLQLISLHNKLSAAYSHFSNLTTNFPSPLNPLATYDLLYSFLLDSISSLYSSGLPPSGTRAVSCTKSPAPWWNSRCAEAVDHCRLLLRLYKSNPTLDNWSAYRKESLSCKRILRREKLLGWRRLCSEFTHKTPTAEIWRFIRSFKNKSLRSDSLPDNSSLLDSQNNLLHKLCPPLCLHLCSIPIHILKAQDSPESPLSWLDDPFTLHELDSAINFSKINSSPGLDRVNYSILCALPLDFRSYLLYL